MFVLVISLSVGLCLPGNTTSIIYMQMKTIKDNETNKKCNHKYFFLFLFSEKSEQHEKTTGA